MGMDNTKEVVVSPREGEKLVVRQQGRFQPREQAVF